MFNTLSEKLYAWTTGWRVIVLFLLDALLMGYVMPVAGAILALAANNSVLPLDMLFFYTPEEAFAMIEKYGEAGRALYMKIELSVDLLYPIVYTLFLSLLISWLFQRAFSPDSKMRTWNTAPVGAWLFDLLENVSIVSLLAVYPSQPELVAWLAILFGLLKWTFVFLSIGLVLWGFVKAALNGFRKQA